MPTSKSLQTISSPVYAAASCLHPLQRCEEARVRACSSLLLDHPVLELSETSWPHKGALPAGDARLEEDSSKASGVCSSQTPIALSTVIIQLWSSRARPLLISSRFQEAAPQRATEGHSTAGLGSSKAASGPSGLSYRLFPGTRTKLGVARLQGAFLR